MTTDKVACEDPEIKELLESALILLNEAKKEAEARKTNFSITAFEDVVTGAAPSYYDEGVEDPDDTIDRMAKEAGLSYEYGAEAGNDEYFEFCREHGPAIQRAFDQAHSEKVDIELMYTPEGGLAFTNYWMPSSAYC